LQYFEQFRLYNDKCSGFGGFALTLAKTNVWKIDTTNIVFTRKALLKFFNNLSTNVSEK